MGMEAVMSCLCVQVSAASPKIYIVGTKTYYGQNPPIPGFLLSRHPQKQPPMLRKRTLDSSASKMFKNKDIDAFRCEPSMLRKRTYPFFQQYQFDAV
jgi:hypothetical protein